MWNSLIFLVFQYSVLLSSFSFEWCSPVIIGKVPEFWKKNHISEIFFFSHTCTCISIKFVVSAHIFCRNVCHRSHSGNMQHTLGSLPSAQLLVWNRGNKSNLLVSLTTKFCLKVPNTEFSCYSTKKTVGETVKWSKWSRKMELETPFSWACPAPAALGFCSQGPLFKTQTQWPAQNLSSNLLWSNACPRGQK